MHSKVYLVGCFQRCGFRLVWYDESWPSFRCTLIRDGALPLLRNSTSKQHQIVLFIGVSQTVTIDQYNPLTLYKDRSSWKLDKQSHSQGICTQMTDAWTICILNFHQSKYCSCHRPRAQYCATKQSQSGIWSIYWQLTYFWLLRHLYVIKKLIAFGWGGTPWMGGVQRYYSWHTGIVANENDIPYWVKVAKRNISTLVRRIVGMVQHLRRCSSWPWLCCTTIWLFYLRRVTVAYFVGDRIWRKSWRKPVDRMSTNRYDFFSYHKQSEESIHSQGCSSKKVLIHNITRTGALWYRTIP